jgi:hypothetical protein
MGALNNAEQHFYVAKIETGRVVADGPLCANHWREYTYDTSVTVEDRGRVAETDCVTCLERGGA